MDPPKKGFKIQSIKPLSVILIVGIFLVPFLVGQDTNQIIFNFQEPFTKTYGGTGWDGATDLIQTIDSGFVITGSISYWNGEHINADMYLVRTDASGNVTWHQRIGGTGEDKGNAIIQTVDGGFAIAGYTTSFGAGESDMWLVKTDTNGVMIWNQTFGGAEIDVAYDLVQTADGGFVMMGNTESFYGAGGEGIWLVKTDTNGVMIWNKTYGEGGSVLIQTTDGGFVLAGYAEDGEPDMALVKTDANGMILWHQIYRTPEPFEVTDIIQTDDGGFALVGGMKTHHYAVCGLCGRGYPEKDVLLLKTDANGVVTWNQSYGGPYEDNANTLVKTKDGGFALAGYTTSFVAGESDMWLVKTDTNGGLQWNQTYGGTGGDGAADLIQTFDGGFALAGYTTSFGAGETYMWLVKTDANGAIQPSSITTTPSSTTISSSTPTPGWGPISLLVAAVVLTTRYKRHKKLK
jgi:hypothetical protein